MRLIPSILSVAVGTIVLVAISLFNTGISLFILGQIDFTSPALPNYPMLITSMPIAGCLATVFGWLVSFIVGGLYVFLHTRTASVTVGDAAGGGAISAGTASLISGIIGVLFSMLMTNYLMQQWNIQVSEANNPLFPANIVMNAGSSMLSTCASAAIAAGIGALGGIAGSALFRGSVD